MNIFADLLMGGLFGIALFSLVRVLGFFQMLSTALQLTSIPGVRKRVYNITTDLRTEQEYNAVKYWAIPIGIMSLIMILLLWIAFVFKVELFLGFYVTAALVISWHIIKVSTFNNKPEWLLQWLASLLVANTQDDIDLITIDIQRLNDILTNLSNTINNDGNDKNAVIALSTLNRELDRLIKIEQVLRTNLEELLEAEKGMLEE